MKRFPILAVAAIILAGCGTTNNSGGKKITAADAAKDLKPFVK